MLQLSRRVSLRMNIGDFLEFQRAFHGDGVVDAAPQKQRMIALNELAGQRFNLGVLSDRRFHGCRQFGDGLLYQGLIQCILRLAPGNTSHEHHECCQLGGERLGRGHTNLRPRFGEEYKVTGTHNGAVIDIADGQLRECIVIRQVLNGRECVGGLARLRDGHHQGAGQGNRAPVAKL